jgi:thiol-disulfide isomerase/thioredoxin
MSLTIWRTVKSVRADEQGEVREIRFAAAPGRFSTLQKIRSAEGEGESHHAMKTHLLWLSLSLVLLLPAARAEEKQLWAKSLLGKPAPKFVVEKWLSTEPDRQGKYVLIDFWATWCGPCRRAIPELNQFHKKFGDKLVVIGVSDEPEEKVKAMKDPKIEYFSAIDPQQRMKKELQVTGIPHVILIDPQGIVRWEGFPLLSGHELTEKVVADILAAKPAPAPAK